MNFIREDFLDDLSVCDQLIDLHKNSNKKSLGCSGSKGTVQPHIKKSTDVCFDPNGIVLGSIEADVLNKYFLNLQDILKRYIEEYKFSDEGNPFYITDDFNIQHYKPNEGFFAWHCERNSNQAPMVTRHLTWMTYLNDLTDEGGTEFYYQKLKVEPKKGKTVIFPSDWTHTHRGVVSKTQEKYIITGWFNYVDKKES